MKKWMKYCLAIIPVILFSYSANAQTGTTKSTSKTSTTKKKTPAKKPAPPLSRKDISISLINSDEHSVSVFAGPKEDLKTAKLKVAGGLSTNTLYVKENDVVCIMDESRKPVACANVLPGTKSVQINSSGNAITRK
ncbi:MAG: hypothetical protein JWO06_3049 [Bacteroidota bacterium]|nr:hypothetical protein [Bacteroidota bacterium]